MARQGASAELNLARNIMLIIGMFNICFYGFVLKSAADTLPKMLETQNAGMPEDKKLTPQVLEEKKVLILDHTKRNCLASIVAGGVIVVSAFLLPYSPGIFSLAGFGAFLLSILFQFYLGFDVVLEGLLIKVLCIFGFFQAVRYSINQEMGRNQLQPEVQVQFPKPD
jgi:hypothetical protein